MGTMLGALLPGTTVVDGNARIISHNVFGTITVVAEQTALSLAYGYQQFDDRQTMIYQTFALEGSGFVSDRADYASQAHLVAVEVPRQRVVRMREALREIQRDRLRRRHVEQAVDAMRALQGGDAVAAFFAAGALGGGGNSVSASDARAMARSSSMVVVPKGVSLRIAGSNRRSLPERRRNAEAAVVDHAGRPAGHSAECASWRASPRAVSATRWPGGCRARYSAGS